jgi:hypothetical protein
VLFLRGSDDGYLCDGAVSAVEAGAGWAVRYLVRLDHSWTTRSAQISGLSTAGSWELRLDADGRGAWCIDGAPAPDLAGCLDIDLEASAFTNALPVHRLQLAVGETANAPAAYVRALEPHAERLEQQYERLSDHGTQSRYEYAAPAFAFHDVLTYDQAGLILDYPGIAIRVA